MERSQFGDAIPGQLVRIAHGDLGAAFLPDALPPTWSFPDELVPLLMEANVALARLDGVGLALPNAELLLRPLQTREAIDSSTIEGTVVTPGQLLFYELDPSEPKDQFDPAAALQEVANCRTALRLGQEGLADRPFTHQLIREMHEALMHGVRGQDKSPGEYRAIQVQIGASGRFVPPPPEELPPLLDNLLGVLRGDSDVQPSDRFAADPLVQSLIAHYQFEALHPFADGNGRIGRVLLSLMIAQRCGLARPWLYLSPFFEDHREEYVRLLFEVSTQGRWREWIEFGLLATRAQARDGIARCEIFRACRDAFYDRIGSADKPGPRSLAIVELLLERPVIYRSTVVDRLGVSYGTAKTDLERLAGLGIIDEMPGTYPVGYVSNPLMIASYSDTPEDATALLAGRLVTS